MDLTRVEEAAGAYAGSKSQLSVGHRGLGLEAGDLTVEWLVGVGYCCGWWAGLGLWS